MTSSNLRIKIWSSIFCSASFLLIGNRLAAIGPRWFLNKSELALDSTNSGWLCKCNLFFRIQDWNPFQPGIRPPTRVFLQQNLTWLRGKHEDWQLHSLGKRSLISHPRLLSRWFFPNFPFGWNMLLFWRVTAHFWSNYSDLTRVFHPKWWFKKGHPLISGKSRLVQYYSISPEYMTYCWWFRNPARPNMYETL